MTNRNRFNMKAIIQTKSSTNDQFPRIHVLVRLTTQEELIRGIFFKNLKRHVFSLFAHTRSHFTILYPSMLLLIVFIPQYV